MCLVLPLPAVGDQDMRGRGPEPVIGAVLQLREDVRGDLGATGQHGHQALPGQVVPDRLEHLMEHLVIAPQRQSEVVGLPAGVLVVRGAEIGVEPIDGVEPGPGRHEPCALDRRASGLGHEIEPVPEWTHPGGVVSLGPGVGGELDEVHGRGRDVNRFGAGGLQLIGLGQQFAVGGVLADATGSGRSGAPARWPPP